MKKKFNRWLTVGIINHAILLGVVYISYVIAGYTVEGEDFGGLMMAYGIILFLPQNVVELAVFVMLFRELFQIKFSEINIILLTLFLITLGCVVMLNFVL